MFINTSQHSWKFFRIGGLDQVAIETAEDLRNLSTLDQKLWVALSCPVKGLEVDEKTLGLIDTDKDGRIRVGEVLAAIDYVGKRVKDLGLILKPGDELAVDQINEDTAEGRAVMAAVRQILSSLDKKNSPSVSLADAASTDRVFAAARFNGDGVLTLSAVGATELLDLVKDVIACHGADKDRGGEEGVSVARLEAFFADLAAYATWQGGAEAALTLGEGTAAAAAAVEAVRSKVDDYFARARLAAFDSRAVGALNRAESDYAAFSTKQLTVTTAEIAALPLARVEAEGALPLLGRVNPAWALALATLHKDIVTPVFGAGKSTLSETEWQVLVAKVQPFLAWQAGKAGAAVEKLGIARVRELLASPHKASLLALAAEDKAVGDEFAAIVEVERLLRYRRDLRVLLANFVNFFDFYSKDNNAVFQAGTLYLDSRATELCVRVDAPSPLAAMSKVFIAYCTCTRQGAAPMTIAACFTQGDSDFLFVGRRGVFYDRAGKDWDAVITSIVDNPISIAQAFWSPYKKFIRMVEEQIAKRAAAADAEASGKLASAAEKTANADKVKAAEAPKKFDLAMVTGIGVAIGAIGGFLATIFAKLVELSIWQLPLVVLVVMLAISTPAMIIAWLKLRQRNLGPILEANGWAVNGRVMINIPFGTALTEKAVLPAGAKRSLTDPYQDDSAKKVARRSLLVFVLLTILAYAGVAWHFQLWPYELVFGKPAAAAEAKPAAVAPEAAPAAQAPAK